MEVGGQRFQSLVFLPDGQGMARQLRSERSSNETRVDFVAENSAVQDLEYGCEECRTSAEFVTILNHVFSC